MASTAEEAFPTPPSYILPGDMHQDVRAFHIHSPLSPLPPPPCFSPDIGCATEIQSPPPVSCIPPSTPMPKFVSYETELYRSPALTTCPSCQNRVTSQVTFRVGTHAWLMCLVFVLCGLLLGCCLIPLFLNYFKDAYHTCPRCRRVLHIQRKTCCE